MTLRSTAEARKLVIFLLIAQASAYSRANNTQDPTAMVVANQADTGLFLRDVSIDRIIARPPGLRCWPLTLANVQQEDTLFTT